MKSKIIAPLVPATLLILTITAWALSKVFLGSVGLWSDIGRNHASLSNFKAISPFTSSALILSLVLASVSTLLSAGLGLLIAHFVHTSKRWGRLLAAVTGVIVITPHIVAAASFNLLLSDSGFLDRILQINPSKWPHFVAGQLWLAVILDFMWKESAFIALVIVASLPPEIEQMKEISTTLGARRLSVATRVLLPTIKPAFVVSSGLAFIYSISSYEATWVLGKTYPEPLAMLTFRLFSNSDLKFRAQAYASSVLSIALIAATSMVVIYLMRRRVKS